MITIRIIIGVMIAFGCFNACTGLAVDALSGIVSKLTSLRTTIFFNALDSDLDGIVKMSELCVITDCISENLRLDEKKKKSLCEDDATQTWKALGFDKAESGHGFHKNMLFNILALGKGSPGFKDAARGSFKRLFKALVCYTDNSTATYDQFRAYHSCIQSDQNITRIAFENADVNKDGGLSEGELCDAGVDFMAGEDDAGPGALIFGKN